MVPFLPMNFVQEKKSSAVFPWYPSHASDIASIFGIPFSIHFDLSSFSPWRFRWQNLIHHIDCLNQFRKSSPTIAYDWNASYNWRYCKETISLWHAVITNTYVEAANGWDAKPSLRGSSHSPWKGISHGYSSFLQCLKFVVGNGDRVRF